MIWDQPVVEEFRDHLQRIGLRTCPVCGSETLGISPAPVNLPWRGPAWRDAGEPGYDAQANILYLFLVTCDLCSHVMLFDSERFTPKDRPVLRRE